MRKFFYVLSVLMLLMQATVRAQVEARSSNSGDSTLRYLVVTASNSPLGNELLVYHADGTLAQALPTGGLGGVSGNSGGIVTYGNLLAVVNFNSLSVSLFEYHHDHFDFIQLVPTLSSPVSVAFGHRHLYILGTTTIESHKLNGDSVTNTPDGFAHLLVADGSAAQVGVLEDELIITEKSNVIEVAKLLNGAVSGVISPVQLPPPPNNNAPFGLITRDNLAYVTIAHSNLVGVVKENVLINLASSQDQNAPCWLALIGHFLYSANAGSNSVSLFEVAGKHIALIQPVAAHTLGAPTDIDSRGNILAVLNTGGGVAYLSQFEADKHGHLSPINSIVTVNGANGIVLIPLIRHHR